MCGIVGVVAKDATSSVRDVILEGLARLEYRGYDSAGLALGFREGTSVRSSVVRSVGPIAELSRRLQNSSLVRPAAEAVIGLGHTRWATHGAVTEVNAHPHRGGDVLIVVNGIIENFREIREALLREGVTLASETDTELVAHLLHREISQGTTALEVAAAAVAKKLRGSYAAVWMVEGREEIGALQMGAPLVIGQKQGCWMIASDASALAGRVDSIAYVPDHTIVTLTLGAGARMQSTEGQAVTPQFEPCTLDPQQLTRGHYPHFMLKEIFEQPESLLRTLSSLVDFNAETVSSPFPKIKAEKWMGFQNAAFIGCGSAYFASLLGKRAMEAWARLPTECELASEFRYRPWPWESETFCLAVTQSGETADTRAAIKRARENKAVTAAITNVPTSTITREVEHIAITRCDPELGVAASKSFTAQVAALQILAVAAAKERDRLTRAQERSFVEGISTIPHLTREALRLADIALKDVSKWSHYRTFLFVGRGELYPLALEGALKLKELTYLHAEGYAAGELKHGPIAIVDEQTLCFVLTGWGELAEKTRSNMEEVRARGATIVTIGEDGDIPLPASESPWGVYPVAVVVQRLAYAMAVALGHDPDRPRNLAKSVTVE